MGPHVSNLAAAAWTHKSPRPTHSFHYSLYIAHTHRKGRGNTPRSHAVSGTEPAVRQDKRVSKCAAAPLLTLRSASAADVNAVHGVIHDCDQSWSVESVQAALENKHSAIKVAMASDDVAAIIAYVAVADEVHIEMIATSPRHRRRGIATKLLRSVFKRFGDRCQYFLEVSRGNTPARELYSKMGFHVYRERRQYYQDGSDALLMTRTRQL